MADQFRDQINTARRAGYTDDQVIGYLKGKDPRITQALEAGYNPDEILQYLAPKLSMGEETTRKLGIAVRGATEALAPATAGATTGFMLGGPVGAGVGLLAGGLAVPASDLVVQGYNKLTDSNVRLPSQVISSMIPGPRAETPVERVVQSSTGALTGTGSSVAAGRAIVQAPNVVEGVKAVGTEAARRPVGQIVTAPIATAAGQTVTEATGNPLAGFVTGVATGTVAGTRPVKYGEVPSIEKLSERSKANYEVLDKSNFQLDNAQFTTHMGSLANKLRSSAGFDPRIMPDVDAALAQLTSGNPKNIQELTTLRAIVGNAAKSTKPAERLAASQLLDEFDDYVMNAPPSAIVAADKKALVAWKEARADYSKMKKGEMISNILDNADVSQGSKEANIANQLSALAKNEKKMRFFSTEEQQAIRDAAKGGTLQSMLRTLSKFTPMTPAAAIFTAVNPLGAYTAAAGMTAKSLAETRRIQEVNRLANRMRLGEIPQVIEGVSANQPVFFSQGVKNMLGPVQQNQNSLRK